MTKVLPVMIPVSINRLRIGRTRLTMQSYLLWGRAGGWPTNLQHLWTPTYSPSYTVGLYDMIYKMSDEDTSLLLISETYLKVLTIPGDSLL